MKLRHTLSRMLQISPCAIAVALFAGIPAASAVPPDDDEEEPMPDAPAPSMAPARMHMSYDFGELAVDGALGVTPGGAQDIRFFRDRVEAGEIPHAAVFTPEGLFSEHDLPLDSRGRRCTEVVCVFGEATNAWLTTQPDVRYLAQLGFLSSIDAATFRRIPQNIIAVVDKSGSMSGTPIEMAQAALRKLASQLTRDDRLTIVLYGDSTHVHLPQTPGDATEQINQAIDRIEIQGSTYMEAGLILGFQEARRTAPAFDGNTRVMLFTDERPNVGNTNAESFMGMAEANSRHGIGMTTIGVGVQFGAELATRISSVRGGNLFYFADREAIEKVFGEELDTIVTELAYDMALEIRPAPGMAIAGVYGIPGDLMEWTDGGGLRLGIATLFASKRKGAIYAAFRPASDAHLPPPRLVAGEPVGVVSLAYQLRDGRVISEQVELPWVEEDQASPGLARGVLLVEEATTLAEAARLHHERNDQEQAWRLVNALQGRLSTVKDEDMQSELTLVGRLEATLAKLSGHEGEPPKSRK